MTPSDFYHRIKNADPSCQYGYQGKPFSRLSLTLTHPAGQLPLLLWSPTASTVLFLTTFPKLSPCINFSLICRFIGDITRQPFLNNQESLSLPISLPRPIFFKPPNCDSLPFPLTHTLLYFCLSFPHLIYCLSLSRPNEGCRNPGI